MVASLPEPVRMGEYLVRAPAEAPGGLCIRGLGSCIAVFIYEKSFLAGGLAHVLLPGPSDRSPLTSPGRFAPTAIAALIDQLLQRGMERADLLAKVTGGAHMFSTAAGESETLGERNIRAALEALEGESIPVAGMDVGGASGRTVLADVGTGSLLVTSLKRAPKLI